ncbi:RibD family protein [Coralloluteibacterium stylophorae]|uniref:RibD family protein n=1 Tax=Coralloluteibacterium stylophorae TaxID=1776034 RepID=A0A8J8AY17_9GAMM|nr:RibD family protein [Coralloluteibacterium stylophorae]MBS7456255.1 RibD family protein [Coralloluteibacterium stylophorae]
MTEAFDLAEPQRLRRGAPDAEHWHAMLAQRGGPAPLRAAAAGLYAPLLAAPRFVLAQVGQSLDGRVATPSGDARDISGPGGLRHLHRCRALVDAVIVGVGTVIADDPRLTVRLVEGRNPVRVVLDPRGRIPRQAGLLHDGAAPLLIVHGTDVPPPVPGADCLALPLREGRFEPGDIVDALAARGLHRVLVEGGACTIAAFIEADRIDRLHVAIAPLIIGCGPSGIALPPIERLAQARRPCATAWELDGDIVFDCDLRG